MIERGGRREGFFSSSSSSSKRSRPDETKTFFVSFDGNPKRSVSFPFFLSGVFFSFLRAVRRERERRQRSRERTQGARECSILCAFGVEKRKRGGKTCKRTKTNVFSSGKKGGFSPPPPPCRFPTTKKGKKKSAFPPFVNEKYLCCWWWFCFVDCELIVEVFSVEKVNLKKYDFHFMSVVPPPRSPLKDFHALLFETIARVKFWRTINRSRN